MPDFHIWHFLWAPNYFHVFLARNDYFFQKKVKPINLHWFWEDVLGMPRVACQIDFLSRARSSEWKITRWQATSGIPTHQFPKSMEVRGLLFLEDEVFFYFSSFQKCQYFKLWHFKCSIGKPAIPIFSAIFEPI